ncbi:uncharacterized protein [Ptychodera flava]|uniref:uncharacterized protein n=1 Tax=Ptychodera flava TaxID=63121 RepID=UPI00396A97E5
MQSNGDEEGKRETAVSGQSVKAKEGKKDSGSTPEEKEQSKTEMNGTRTGVAVSGYPDSVNSESKTGSKDESKAFQKNGGGATAKDYSMASVKNGSEANGKADPRDEIERSSSIKVNAIDGGKVNAKDGGKVNAKDSGKVNAKDGGKVNAKDGGKVNAKDSGKVNAIDDGKVNAKDSGKVNAKDGGKVNAKDGGKVNAKDGGKVNAKDGGKVNAKDGGKVNAKDGGKVNAKDGGKVNAKDGGKVNAKDGGKVNTKDGGKSGTGDSKTGSTKNGAGKDSDQMKGAKVTKTRMVPERKELPQENMESKRSKLKKEMIKLLQAHEGCRIRYESFSTAYNQRFHKNLIAKDFGVKRMNELFSLFSDIFTIENTGEPKSNSKWVVLKEQFRGSVPSQEQKEVTSDSHSPPQLAQEQPKSNSSSDSKVKEPKKSQKPTGTRPKIRTELVGTATVKDDLSSNNQATMNSKEFPSFRGISNDEDGRKNSGDKQSQFLNKDKLKVELINLLKVYKYGIPEGYVHTAYSRMYKKGLAPKQYGLTNMDSVFEEFDDIFYLHATGNCDEVWMDLDAKYKNHDVNVSDFGVVLDEKGLKQLKEEFVELLRAEYPKSICWKDVPKKYNVKFCKSLNTKKCGLADKDDLLFLFLDIFESKPTDRVLDKFKAKLSQEYVAENEGKRETVPTTQQPKRTGKKSSSGTTSNSDVDIGGTKSSSPSSIQQEQAQQIADEPNCAEKEQYISEVKKYLQAFDTQIAMLQSEYMHRMQRGQQLLAQGVMDQREFAARKHETESYFLGAIAQLDLNKKQFMQMNPIDGVTTTDAPKDTIGGALLPTPQQPMQQLSGTSADMAPNRGAPLPMTGQSVQPVPLMSINTIPQQTNTKPTTQTSLIGAGDSTSNSQPAWAESRQIWKVNEPTGGSVMSSEKTVASKSSSLDEGEWPDLFSKVESSSTSKKRDAPAVPRQSNSITKGTKVTTQGVTRVSSSLAVGNQNAEKMTSSSDVTRSNVNSSRNMLSTLKTTESYVYKGGIPSKEYVNTVCDDIITKLAESGEYVTVDKVTKMLFQHFNVSSLRELNYRNEKQIDRLFQLHQLQCKVSAYIHAFLMVRSISTAHELVQSLSDIEKTKNSYTELNLGPIAKNPLVHDMFKLPPSLSDSDIPPINTIDIMRHLRAYMRKYDCWRTSVDLTKFMEYLMVEYNCDEPYQLGVRIQSIALAISVIKKAQRDEKATFDRIRVQVAQDLEEEIEAKLQKVKSTLLDSFGDQTAAMATPGYDLRKKYASMTAADVIMDVLMAFKQISIDRPLERHMERFINAILMNPLARQMFQLAICTGRLEPPEGFMIGGQTSHDMESHDASAAENVNDVDTQQQIPPTAAALLQQLVKYLERCQGNLNLSILSRIEKKLADHFKFESFLAMGHGTFLEYINNHPQMLEEYGGSQLGIGSSGSTVSGSIYRPNRQDILEFIQQCGALDKGDLIESSLSSHYKLSTVRELGHGSLLQLINTVKKQQRNTSDLSTSTLYSKVIYETAFCTSNRITEIIASGEQRTVGILGSQQRGKAMACLMNAPLLEDLAAWSHWSLVFEPEHGDIKQFIERNSGTMISDSMTGVQFPFDVCVLEPKPGVLLKLTTTTSPAMFAEHAGKGDARPTAGHLVSIVIQYGGFKNSPLALLANMMESAFAKLCVGGSAPGAPQPYYEDDYELNNYSTVLDFVMTLLMYIPTQICVAIANQVIVEPLGRAVGATKSKTLLAKYCKNSAEKSRLQELGLLLGINEWVISFNERTVVQPPVAMMTPEDANNVHEGPQQAGAKETAERDTGMDSYYDPMVHGDIQADSDADISSDRESDMDSDTDNESSDTESSDIEDLFKTESGSESVGNNIYEQVIVGDADVPTDESKTNSDDGVMDVHESSIEVVDKIKGQSDTDKVEGEMEDKDEGKNEEGDDREDEEQEMQLTEEELREIECHRVIDEIRQYEFGVGIQLTEEAANLMERLQNRTGRGLERLSTELYSKDTHFVLELVQNADDNSYDDDTSPALKFIVEKDCVTVLNNESGFRERDIRALCDVGKSTKGKHKYGYIGQKGIGFKSVFRVTDKPSIHSNGYHMCFDAKSGPVGYILPHWIGDDDDPQSTCPVDSDSWRTKIVLPLKTEIQHSRSLGNRFHDIHPSLLLFLHRLKSITIEDKVSSETRCMKRTDGDHSVIEIQHGDGLDRWLVVKKQLNATKMIKENVESTELALAFLLQPTSVDGGTLYAQSEPSKQKVFAFLPLRSYGFRFVIQGDFDVPSSREDVDNDSAWNQWLRGELPVLFIQALQAFKDHPDLSELNAVCSFLQYVPMEGEILGFFKPVAKQILQQLKASPCLPTDVKSSDGSFDWKLPSELAVTRDPLLREVISPDLLHNHLNRSYLHPHIVSSISLPLINMLGVQTLSVKNLIEIGKAVSASAQVSGETLSISFVAKWLACLHRLMESDYSIQEDDVIQEVQTIPIIPLSNGQVVALDRCSVFFPLTANRQADLGAVPKNKKKMAQSRLMALEKDLNLVPYELLSCLDEVCNSQVHSVLMSLGVCEMKPREVIKNHIIPVFKSDQWKEKSHTLLMEYLIYIKEESEKMSSVCNLEELKEIVKVVTNHGLVNPATQPTHFTTDYGNKVDLQGQLPGFQWILLDSCYLQHSREQPHVNSWEKFFSKLGVLHSLAIKKEMITIPESEIIHSPWSHVYKFWPRPEDGNYRIEDWVCDEFHGLVTTENITERQKLSQSQVLMKILEEDWDSSYSKYTNASVCNKEGVALTNTQSSFGIYAATLPWLPAVHHHPNGQQEIPVYLTGRDIYLHSDVVYSLLADHVYYLVYGISNTSMVQHLQIKTAGHINAQVILDNLLHWCTGQSTVEEAESTKKGSQFQTSLAHISNVYKYLEREGAPSTIQKFFESYPAIFVPEVPVGQFYHKSDVYWHDSSGLFVKYAASALSSSISVPQRPQLLPIYQDLEGFFCGQAIKVDHQPKMTDYIALLLHVVDITVLPDYEKTQDIYHLFAVLGEKCLEKNFQQPDVTYISPIYSKHLRGMIEKERVFPTKSNRWVSLNDGVFIPDDKHIEKLFQDKQQVNLLDLGESKVSVHVSHRNKQSRQKRETKKYDERHLQTFLEACEVPHLSKCIDQEFITESFKPCPPLQNFFHDIVPYLQLFVYNKYEEEVYCKLTERKMASLLQIMQFGQVGKLQAIYRMKTDEAVFVVEDVVCSLVEQRQFYIEKSYVESIRSYPLIRDQICKMFSEGNLDCQQQMKNFLRILMPFLDGQTGESREEFLESQDFEDLAEDEEKWEVREARPPTPPPPPPPPPPPTPPPVLVQPEQTKDDPVASETETDEDKVSVTGLNEDGTPVLPCWPPKAGGYGTSNKGGKSRVDEAAEASIKMWPPPAPLEDRTSEPESNIRMVNSQGSRHGVREDQDNRHDSHDAPPAERQKSREYTPSSDLVKGESEDKQHGRPTDSLPQNETSGREELLPGDQQHHQRQAKRESSRDESIGQADKQDVNLGKENMEVDQIKDNSGPSGDTEFEGKPKKKGFTRKYFNFTQPTWKTQDLDDALEELGTGDALMKQLPTDAILEDSDDLTVVGKWGEALVYNFLLHQKETMDSDDTDVEVIWVNEQEESGQPYDIEIKVRSTEDGIEENGEVEIKEYSIYIEVKSTRTKGKQYFEISSQELAFAEKMQSQFHLYRVYNAGSADRVKLCRVPNLAEKLDTKTVRLCMFV